MCGPPGARDTVCAEQRSNHGDPGIIRNRVLAPEAVRAKERLSEAGEVPLPERLTPHKLRHTLATVLVALGRDMRVTASQLGHTYPVFTLRVYSHAMQCDQGLRLCEQHPADPGQRPQLSKCERRPS